jgi:hypothetical protein
MGVCLEDDKRERGDTVLQTSVSQYLFNRCSGGRNSETERNARRAL